MWKDLVTLAKQRPSLTCVHVPIGAAPQLLRDVKAAAKVEARGASARAYLNRAAENPLAARVVSQRDVGPKDYAKALLAAKPGKLAETMRDLATGMPLSKPRRGR